MTDDDDALDGLEPLGPEAPQDDAPPGVDPAEFRALVAECAALPLNDLGNAQRFVKYFGRDVMWVPRLGWFAWDGRRWAADSDKLAVRRLAQQLSDRILREIPHIALTEVEAAIHDRRDEVAATLARLQAIKPADRSPEDEARLAEARALAASIEAIGKGWKTRRDAHRRFARLSGNSGPIEKALHESEVAKAAPVDALDADPLALNCLSGVLRFEVTRGEGMSPVCAVRLDPHERADLMTKMMPVDYAPGAAAPRFDAFLARVQPDPEMRAFLQRLFGLCLTALTGEQKLAFLYGTGANGKSVLMELMARIWGDYAATAKIESLTGQSRRGGGDATPDLVPLMGARLVRASEPEQGERLKEAVIKELTGGEPMLIRALHSDFVEMRPVAKIVISGNHKPEIRGGDEGIWRRMMLVSFDQTIPPEERDPQLIDKLWDERVGVFAWCVEGLVDYLEGGLRPPARVIEATADYRAESDPIGTFLTDCTVVTGASEDFMSGGDLRDACQFWLREQFGAEWGGRTVSLRLRDKAGAWRHPASGACFTRAKSGVTGFRGIRLTEVFARRMADAPSPGGREQHREADDF